jgi:hypothetical protein
MVRTIVEKDNTVENDRVKTVCEQKFFQVLLGSLLQLQISV